MEYRQLGRTGCRVSAVSLGTEYLINLPREHVVGVIRDAMDRGVNYFDLFFAQADIREHVGAAIHGHRSEVMLTAHLGSVLESGQHAKSRDPAVAEPYIYDYLKQVGTDYIDVLFVFNIDSPEDYQRVTAPGGLFEMAYRFKEQGIARFVAMSGHNVVTSQQAVESGLIDVLMFPVNIAANAIPGKRDLLRACVANDVGLVAMKPYAGGRLLREMAFTPRDVHVGGSLDEVRRTKPITPVQCISYVLAQPGISTIVPGCQTIEHVADAQKYWIASEEERDFAALLADVQQYVEGECVYCNHCLPCPAEIDIGQVMRLGDLAGNGMDDELRTQYEALAAHASDCTQCASCAAECPFGADPPSRMIEIEQVFGH